METRKIFHFSAMHGTGKTSLICDLSTRFLKNATVIDNDQYFFYPREFAPAQLKRIKVGYESYCHAVAPLIIGDRGPFDALLYSETLHEFGEITSEELAIIRETFQSLPADYRFSGYFVFLDPPVERIIKNIKDRNREGEPESIMGDPQFLIALHKKFERFYAEMQKIVPVAIFRNTDKHEYNAEEIIKELQQRCWLQPYEIQSHCCINYDKYGFSSRMNQMRSAVIDQTRGNVISNIVHSIKECVPINTTFNRDSAVSQYYPYEKFDKK